MQTPDLRQQLQTNGMRILSLPMNETETFIKAEVQRWPQFIQQAGIKAEGS